MLLSFFVGVGGTDTSSGTSSIATARGRVLELSFFPALFLSALFLSAIFLSSMSLLACILNTFSILSSDYLSLCLGEGLFELLWGGETCILGELVGFR